MATLVAVVVGSVALPPEPASAAPASETPGLEVAPEETAARPPRGSFVLDEIRVVPDDATLGAIVRRHLPFREGQTVAADALLGARDAVAAACFFERVQAHTERGREPGHVILVLEVDPGSAFSLETGLGHDELDGWFLNIIGFRYTNPTGRGDELRAGAHVGLRFNGAAVRYAVPWSRNTDLLAEATVGSREWIAHDDLRQYYQDTRIHALSLGIRRRHASPLTTTLRLGYHDVAPEDSLHSDDEDAIAASVLVPEPDGTDRFLEARLDLVWDARNPARPWREGRWAGLRLRGTAAIDASDFWSVEGDVRQMVPVTAGTALAFRAMGGYSGPGTTYHQRFIVGGAGSVRGYPAGKLSGPMGASAFWQGSAELRRTLLGDPRSPRVVGTLFADVGDQWSHGGSRGGVVGAVGYGVAIRIPWIEVVDLGVGYPVTRRRTNDAVVVHASLGWSF